MMRKIICNKYQRPVVFYNPYFYLVRKSTRMEYLRISHNRNENQKREKHASIFPGGFMEPTAALISNF